MAQLSYYLSYFSAAADLMPLLSSSTSMTSLTMFNGRAKFLFGKNFCEPNLCTVEKVEIEW